MRNNKIFLVVDLVPQEEVIVIAYTKKKRGVMHNSGMGHILP
jgi:hypothetical protein